jgi:hypothetical protein
MTIGRTVHPAKSFSRYHLEIDPLITILGVDKMRKPDSVEFLRYHTIEVNERSRHPIPTVSSVSLLIHGNNLHVKEAVSEALGIFEVPVALQAYPRHDLVRWPFTGLD